MRFHLLLLLAALSLPALAEPPEVGRASIERPLPTSGEVGIPDVVLLQGEALPAAPAPDSGPSFLAKLVPSLLDLLATAAIAGIGVLAAFLRAKAAESRAAKVGLVVTEAARAAVMELDATIKPTLKAYLADGKLSDEEKAELKKMAMDLLKTKLPAGLLSTAGSVFGAFTDTYLAGKIEQAVAAKNALEIPVPPKA